MRALFAILAVLLTAWPASATISRVQEVIPACATGDVTITLPGAVTAGNLVHITVVLQTTSATADITGDDFAFTAVGPSRHATQPLTIYHFWGIGGTDNEYLADQSGSVDICVYAQEYAGAETSSPVDGSCSSDDTDTAHACGSGVAQTVPGVCISAIRSTSTATWTAGTGYTRQDTFADLSRTGVEDKITSSTETCTGDWTSSVSETSHLFMVAYKEAGGGGGGGSAPDGLLWGVF